MVQSLKMMFSAPPTRSRLGIIGRKVEGLSRTYHLGLVRYCANVVIRDKDMQNISSIDLSAYNMVYAVISSGDDRHKISYGSGQPLNPEKPKL